MGICGYYDIVEKPCCNVFRNRLNMKVGTPWFWCLSKKCRAPLDLVCQGPRGPGTGGLRGYSPPNNCSAILFSINFKLSDFSH